MNTSRYGRLRKPSDIAKACVAAFYKEEGFVDNWEDYLFLAEFMGNNFCMKNANKNYSYPEDYPGHWHTEWTFQGLD